MTATVEELAENRSVIVTISAPINFPADVEIPLSAGLALKEKLGAPICRIMDFTHSHLQFSDMVNGLGGELGKPGGFWDQDVYSIVIGTNEWVKFGIESVLEQEQYRGANIKGLVATREEALAIAASLVGR
jgi:hypothetical protein